jgi:hypothetical protein
VSANSPNPEDPVRDPILDFRFCVFRTIADPIDKDPIDKIRGGAYGTASIT